MDGLTAELRAAVSAVLPGQDLTDGRLARGQFHDVVLLESVAAVRVARRPADAAQLTRRSELLRRLGSVGLPFAVPQPLSDVIQVGEFAAVAVSWIPGSPLPLGQGEPAQLGQLLAAVKSVDLAEVADILDRPHAYAGREHWLDLLLEGAIPLLPVSWRTTATDWVQEADALGPVEPCLVHGDLGGTNLHWDSDGRLVGVLDWDLAQPFDHAADVACLAYQGWENLRPVVDPDTFDRALAWWRTFGIQSVAAAVESGEPDDIVALYVEGAVRWLEEAQSRISAVTLGFAPPDRSR